MATRRTLARSISLWHTACDSGLLVRWLSKHFAKSFKQEPRFLWPRCALRRMSTTLSDASDGRSQEVLESNNWSCTTQDWSLNVASLKTSVNSRRLWSSTGTLLYELAESRQNYALSLVCVSGMAPGTIWNLFKDDIFWSRETSSS